MAKTSRLIATVGVLWVLAAACAPAAAPPTPTPLKPAAKPTAAPPPQVAATPKPAAPAAKQQLVMGTPPTTSSYYIYCVAATKVINKEVPEVAVTAVSTGGAEENMLRMQRGEQDFALVGLDGVYRAYKGIGRNWEKQPFTELRTFWAATVGAVAFIVREDSGVKAPRDLEGKDFNPGGRGTTTEVLAKDVLQAVGIAPKYYIGGMDDAVQATKDRRIVGFVKTTALENPDATILDMMTGARIRILEWPQELIDKASAQYPHYKQTEIPAGVYKADWNAKPIRTWAQGLGIVGPTRLPEDIVYKITKAIVADKTEQYAAYPATARDIPKLTMEQAVIPLHLGAYKFYKELGLKIPEAIVPPEAR